ncbi:MAG: lytic transglycosylase domain-containing protein [Vicinamibacterales bacterium]
MKVGFLLLVVCLAVASPATAQIYTWHDAQGTLVLSDRPHEQGQIPTYEVYGGSKTIRATKALAISSKSIQYDASIREHASRNGLSPELVRAVIQVESAFNPNAISPKGAMGLMQLMPATATEYGVRNPFHPEQNIGGGVAYLKHLLDRYNNKIELALAAYNAGPGNVEKYGAVPPFKETQSYVKRVTGAAPAAPPNTIFKWMDLVDGHPVMRYSNAPPPTGAYEVVGKR